MPFTGVHRYEMDASCTAEPGEPVKLLSGKIVHCTTADDPACIGLLTGEIVIVAEPDENDAKQQGQKQLSAAKKENLKKKIKPKKTGEPWFQATQAEETSHGLKVTDGTVIHHVAACGDSVCAGLGGAKVCNESGAVLAGDYLSTANKKGFLKKFTPATAADMRKVVAWVPEAVTFDKNGEAENVYLYLMR